jgi:hypothetical protein
MKSWIVETVSTTTGIPGTWICSVSPEFSCSDEELNFRARNCPVIMWVRIYSHNGEGKVLKNRANEFAPTAGIPQCFNYGTISQEDFPSTEPNHDDLPQLNTRPQK